jgi:thiol:disulfide interchange protein
MRLRGLARPGDVLFVLGLLAPSVATAQAPAFLDADAPTSRVETPHLTAVAEAVPTEAVEDGRVTLVLRVVPRPGMRVYAHDVTGYLPFSIDLDDATQGGPSRGPVDWPAASRYVFPPTGESSRVYDGPVVVRQTVTLGPEARQAVAGGDAGAVAATIRYQACDDRLCYRPTTARIVWSIAPPTQR